MRLGAVRAMILEVPVEPELSCRSTCPVAAGWPANGAMTGLTLE